MLGPFDYLVWFFGAALQYFVVVRAAIKHYLGQYLSIHCYMLAAALATSGRFWIVHTRGFASLEYRNFYYYSDALLTILLFIAVLSLYHRVFLEMQVSLYIRVAAIMLLFGTAWFSYMVVRDNKDHLTSRFVIELSQNLYFVGVVLTYVLWGAVVKLRETRARLVHLVLSLGIFFSAHAVIYALRNLFPDFSLLRSLPPLVGTFLPLAWAYTFTRIPEEARLAPARVAAVHR